MARCSKRDLNPDLVHAQDWFLYAPDRLSRWERLMAGFSVCGCKGERGVGSVDACSHSMIPLAFPLFFWGADHQGIPSGPVGSWPPRSPQKSQCQHTGGEPEVQPSGIYGDKPSAVEELHMSTHHMSLNIQSD